MMIVIDATKTAIGRVASFAAKQALLGKEVKIVNCNSSIVIGTRTTILAKYKSLRAKGGAAQKGPYFPKSPERILKRTVRGMLSHRQGRGRDALKKVICYNEVPTEFADAEKISLARPLKIKPITLKEISKEL